MTSNRNQSSVTLEGEPNASDFIILDSTSVAYLLGRLFHTIVQIQLQAHDYEVDSSFKAQIMGFPNAARDMMSRILRLSEIHEQKIERSHRHIRYVVRKKELIVKITNLLGDFALIPVRFTRDESLSFFSGYHSQSAFDWTCAIYYKRLKESSQAVAENERQEAVETELQSLKEKTSSV
jgi:hypothetical protein